MDKIISIIIISVISCFSQDTLVIQRMYYENFTLGKFKGMNVYTIEPPLFVFTGKHIFSCIAEGTYKVKFQRMATYGMKEIRLLLLNKETNSQYEITKTDGKFGKDIFIHEGYGLENTSGCILASMSDNLGYYEKEQKIRFINHYKNVEGLDSIELFFTKGLSKSKVEGKIVGFVRIEEAPNSMMISKIKDRRSFLDLLNNCDYDTITRK